MTRSKPRRIFFDHGRRADESILHGAKMKEFDISANIHSLFYR
jgi:hypothetical protein